MTGWAAMTAMGLALALSTSAVAAPPAPAAPQQSAPANAITPPTFDQTAHFAMLETLLGAKDYGAIKAQFSKAGSAAEYFANLDWLGAKFKQGESTFIALNYSMMLSAVADNQSPQEAEGLRGTALAALLYAISVGSIEGQQCDDQTARLNRAEQYMGLLGESKLLEIQETSRQQAAYIALMIEQSTWPRRKAMDDTRFLCANGMAAMMAGLKDGQTAEQPAQAGQTGRQIAVTPPADFVSARRKDAEWWADAEKMRQRLRETVMGLAQIKTIPAG